MTSSVPRAASRDWGFARSTSSVALLVAHGRERGVAASRLLVGTGLRVADLENAHAEVTAAQELRVVRTLRHLLGEVGTEVGERYRPSTFGAFGFAMTSSRTVGDAIEVALRFIDLSFAFAIPHAEMEDERVVITIDGADLPADVRRFLFDRDVAAVRAILDGLVPGGVGAVEERAGDVVRIVFGIDQLDRPLPHRSENALAAAAEVCTEVVGRRRARTGLAKDVRVLITQQLGDGAPMGVVAGSLAMSERTLRRRLAAEGVSYQGLLDEVRSSLAAALLDGPATMPVAEVGRRLGYGSLAAFSHARARWRATSRR